MGKIALELGVDHYDRSDAGSIEEMLHVTVRRIFAAGRGKTGVCLGGKYTPYITVFVPANMGYDLRRPCVWWGCPTNLVWYFWK